MKGREILKPMSGLRKQSHLLADVGPGELALERLAGIFGNRTGGAISWPGEARSSPVVRTVFLNRRGNDLVAGGYGETGEGLSIKQGNRYA